MKTTTIILLKTLESLTFWAVHNSTVSVLKWLLKSEFPKWFESTLQQKLLELNALN